MALTLIAHVLRNELLAVHPTIFLEDLIRKHRLSMQHSGNTATDHAAGASRAVLQAGSAGRNICQSFSLIYGSLGHHIVVSKLFRLEPKGDLLLCTLQNQPPNIDQTASVRRKHAATIAIMKAGLVAAAFASKLHAPSTV